MGFNRIINIILSIQTSIRMKMIIPLLFFFMNNWYRFGKRSIFMSKLEIARGETKRRSFQSALVYSAEPPLGWEGEG